MQPAVMARAASMCVPKQVARALRCRHMRPNTKGERPCSTQLSIKLPTKAALQHLTQHGQLGVAPTSPDRHAQGAAQPAAKKGDAAWPPPAHRAPLTAAASMRTGRNRAPAHRQTRDPRWPAAQGAAQAGRAPPTGRRCCLSRSCCCPTRSRCRRRRQAAAAALTASPAWARRRWPCRPAPACDTACERSRQHEHSWPCRRPALVAAPRIHSCTMRVKM